MQFKNDINHQSVLCRLYCVHTCISHVMDLIKDDPRHFSHDLRPSVKHAPQNLGENKFTTSDQTSSTTLHRKCMTLLGITVSHLCCHHKAGSGGVDGDISSHQTNILEILIHLSVFLVGQSLDGAGEDHSLLLSEGQSNGISARGWYECGWNHISDINWLTVHFELKK